MAKSNAHLNAESELPGELRQEYNHLVDDYIAAKDQHVPTYRGGPSYKNLAELIRMGWRKTDAGSN